MPPKIKASKEDIINATVSIIKEAGEEGFNARSIAKALNCSTQPIFSNFESMEDLKTQALIAVNKIYNDYTAAYVQNSSYPPYKASGMAYIEFAKNEKSLFKFLFMRDRRFENEIAKESEDFGKIVENVKNRYSLSLEKAEDIHLKLWIFIHGIATMLVTDYLDFDEESISKMLTDMFIACKKEEKQ